jgi:hypothetical protein
MALLWNDGERIGIVVNIVDSIHFYVPEQLLSRREEGAMHLRLRMYEILASNIYVPDLS